MVYFKYLQRVYASLVCFYFINIDNRLFLLRFEYKVREIVARRSVLVSGRLWIYKLHS